MPKAFLRYCHYCREFFVSRKKYRQHQKNYRFQCGFLKIRRNAKGRIIGEEIEFPQCAICEDVFCSYRELQEHLKKCCHICDREFETVNLARFHRLMYLQGDEQRRLTGTSTWFKY
ncbi:unnamed protein product [Hymenolepis diminuta]|uniref:C2H2-type domain-containing protein n=1 Tax=Hymenolepis diminuta TaxID=6216 RepID=A0A564YAL5_HYMDI|nr:unnamed protein product [Hymenolepis diminuta]